MTKLPKPRARFIDGHWHVYSTGTITCSGWTIGQALLAWVHRNWTQSRIMRP